MSGSQFSLFLIKLVGSAVSTNSECFLHDLAGFGEGELSFIGCKLVRDTFGRVQHFDSRSFDCADIGFTQTRICGRGGDVTIGAGERGVDEEVDHLFFGFRNHPVFLQCFCNLIGGRSD